MMTTPDSDFGALHRAASRGGTVPSTAFLFLDFLIDCCAEVLDTMYFTTVRDATPEGELLPLRPGDFGFTLHFEGDLAGRFGLHVDYATAYSLAANFLGQDGGELRSGEVGDVVGELTNMLCGAVMSRVPSAHTFVLSHPERLATIPDLSGEDAFLARLAMDTGEMTIWIAVDRPRGGV